MKAKDDIESIVRPLRKSLGLFEAALAVVDDAIAVFTNEEKLIWCNKSFETFAGESRMRLLGKSVGDCLLGYTSDIDTDNVYKIAKERKSRSPEIIIKNTKRNQSFIIETHFTRYEEKEHTFTMVIKNVTDKYNAKTFEKKAIELAEEIDTCSLTGIYNRRGIMKQIEQSLKHKQDSGFYIIFCDVDNFKAINDVHGHEIGDLVLKKIAGILKKCTRNSDFVGRISGDEFIIGVTTKQQDVSTPDSVARRILNEVDKGILFRRAEEKIKIDLSVSLGIADSRDAIDSQSLLHMADAAMYKSKKNKSGISFYNKQMKKTDKLRGFLRKVSEEVFNGADLPFHIQPISNLQTGEIHGYEVLMRPISTEGIIAPTEDFVRAHELNGDIQALDLLLFQSVCNTIPRSFLSKDNKFLTINISAINMVSKSFISEFMKILKESDLDKNQIIVEITETAFIDNHSSFKNGIKLFNDEGVSVFLDDFGVGNTSCNELIYLPIDGFKVDSKLFNASKTKPKALSVLRFLSEFGKDNDLCVIAEGIEDDDDLIHANRIGYQYVQGYKISPPFPYSYFTSAPEINEKNGLSCFLSQKINYPFL